MKFEGFGPALFAMRRKGWRDLGLKSAEASSIYTLVLSREKEKGGLPSTVTFDE